MSKPKEHAHITFLTPWIVFCLKKLFSFVQLDLGYPALCRCYNILLFWAKICLNIHYLKSDAIIFHADATI